MEMLVTKFSNGKYRNEGELFAEPISAENVKLMGEMIALQALRNHKKFDMKVADRLYIGLIKDLIDFTDYKALPMDPVNCFEQEQTDYTKYDELVGVLQLSALELTILNCYMNGMVQSEVCAELGIGRGTIYYRKVSVRQRYQTLYGVY